MTFDDGATSLGTGTISNGIATLTTSALAVGTHSITAQYGGDSNYNGAVSTPISQVVNQVSSTVTLASSLNPSTFGASVTLTATVTSGATGTVTFHEGATSLGTGTISGRVATLTTSSLTVGTHSITAQYGGDSNYNASVSTAVSQVVNKATSARHSDLFAQSIDVWCQRDAYGDGHVRSNRDGNLPRRRNVRWHGNNQRWRCHVSHQFARSRHTLDYGALFRGCQLRRRHFIGGLSGCEQGDLDRHSRILTEPLGLRCQCDSYGDGHVRSDRDGDFPGRRNVPRHGNDQRWHRHSDDQHTCSGHAFDYGAVWRRYQLQRCGLNSGISGCEQGDLDRHSRILAEPLGLRCQRDSYGDGHVRSDRDGDLRGRHNVSRHGDDQRWHRHSDDQHTCSGHAFDYGAVWGRYQLQHCDLNGGISGCEQGDHDRPLASSPNPSTFGASVTLTATVTSGATGTVTFQDGATSLGTGTISGGIATLTTSTLAVGTHSITAQYGGDSNYSASNSTAVSQVVNKAASTVTLASSLNPSTFGASVTLTATVTSGATGTVSFHDGATEIGTGTISNGVATLTIGSLSVGTHSITAQYVGMNNYNTAVSTAVSQVVSLGDPDGQPGLLAEPLDVRGECDLHGYAYDRSHRHGDLPRWHNVPWHGNDQQWHRHPDDQFACGGHALDHRAVWGRYQLQRRHFNRGISGCEHGDQYRRTGFLAESLDLRCECDATATVTTGATGTVTFHEGATSLGTGTISSGVATLTTSSLAGEHIRSPRSMEEIPTSAAPLQRRYPRS